MPEFDLIATSNPLYIIAQIVRNRVTNALLHVHVLTKNNLDQRRKQRDY